MRKLDVIACGPDWRLLVHWTPRAWWVVTERPGFGFTPRSGPFPTAEDAAAVLPVVVLLTACGYLDACPCASCSGTAGRVHRDLPIALALALATLGALLAVARGWFTMR